MRIAAQLICIAIVAHATLAAADDPAPVQPQPWAVGVSAEAKATARVHLDAGNELLLERKYSEALAEYRIALAAWNHPAIRFNVVRCLIQLERLVEASDELKLALQYGSAPFDETTIYDEALGYEKLLATQVGTLEINCVQPGVELRMDGQVLPACPTTEVRRVMPGQHQIVGKKDGFVPRTVEIVVFGGSHQSAALVLDPLVRVARIEHRWKTWIPWTVIAGGFALGGIGELLHIKATTDNEAYTKMISDNCKDRCPPGTLDDSLKSSASVENGVAISMFATGAAVAITGGVMLYLNRGHTVYDTNEKPLAAQLHVVPLPTGAAIGVTGRF